MKKLVLIMLAAIAVPALAGSITIDVNDQGDGTGIVQITDITGVPPVCVALVVTANDGGDGDTVVDVNAPVDSFFDVFPDFYNTTPGAMDDDDFSNDGGHPGADPAGAGVLESGDQVSLSMGELDDVDNADDMTLPIDLAVIDLGAAGDVQITVDALRGGIVDVNLGDVTVVYAQAGTGLFDITSGPAECMKDTAPEYATWVSLGKPDCWCYAKQCRGDINGTMQGPFTVGSFDLDAFRLAFNKMALPAGGICADLNHAAQGPFRVGSFDLDIFRLYFNKMVVPVCDSTNYNFWITP